jgi:hypothetical protein
MKHKTFWFLLVLTLYMFFIGCNNKEASNNDENRTDALSKRRKELLFVDTLSNCELAIKKAEDNFNAGTYTVIVCGLLDDGDFEYFYSEYLRKKHGIKVLYAGCTPSSTTRCYAKKMAALLYDKGINIVWTEREKAKKQYEKVGNVRN